jgi:predicted ATPase
MLAETHAKLGRPDESLNCLTEAATIIEMTEGRLIESALHRLRGEVLNATGDEVAAEQSYSQALAVARRQEAKLWELRAATSLARLWRDQGRRAEARDLLAPVCGWFTEGFGTPVLQEAKALLEELAHAPASSDREGLAAAGAGYDRTPQSGIAKRVSIRRLSRTTSFRANFQSSPARTTRST